MSPVTVKGRVRWVANLVQQQYEQDAIYLVGNNSDTRREPGRGPVSGDHNAQTVGTDTAFKGADLSTVKAEGDVSHTWVIIPPSEGT